MDSKRRYANYIWGAVRWIDLAWAHLLPPVRLIILSGVNRWGEIAPCLDGRLEATMGEGKGDSEASPPVAPPPVPPVVASPPVVHLATLGPNGWVHRGEMLTIAQATDIRRSGQDIVVCGPNEAANRSMARAIETTANGTVVEDPPHINAGTHAMAHFHPRRRTPAGHSFFETTRRGPFS